MSRPNYSTSDCKEVFDRDRGTCQICHDTIYFKNRRRGQPGAWEMGHSKAYARGGSSHLRYIVALCWKCNLKQGTKSLATMNRGMEYNDTGNKVRSFLNDKLLGDGVPSFDLHRAKRSMSVDGELEDFKKRLQNNSRDWADKKFAYLRPLASRYRSTNDPNYRKFDIMIKMIIQKYGNN